MLLLFLDMSICLHGVLMFYGFYIKLQNPKDKLNNKAYAEHGNDGSDSYFCSHEKPC